MTRPPDDNTPPDAPHAPGTDTDPQRGEVSEARPDLLRRLLDILGWESGTEEQSLEALADAVRVARGGRMGKDVHLQRNEARAECRRLHSLVEWLERMLEESNRCSACGCYASDHVVDDEELRECLRCACTQYLAGEHPAAPVEGPGDGLRAECERLVRRDGELTAALERRGEENAELRRQLDSCHERAADLAGHYRQLVQERNEARAECERLQRELRAAREAVGEGWFAGGVSLAQAIKRKARFLEELLPEDQC